MSKPLIPISRRRALWFAVFLVLYEFLTYVANDMVMPAMVNVVADFAAPNAAIASSLTTYILGGASLQLILGPISDCYGRRPVMLVGSVLFLFFTIGIACTQNIHQFLLLRFFQGMGLCFIAVIGYATLQEIYAEMDAVRLISVMASVAITAPLLGPLLGAFLMHYMTWRSIFLCIALAALGAVYGLWRFMPESIGQRKYDGELIASIPLSWQVVFDNYRALLKNRAAFCGAIGVGVLGIPCVAWIGVAPTLIIIDGHESVLAYALWQIPLFSACIVGNAVLRRASHHYKLEQLVKFGAYLVLLSLGLSLLLPCLMGGTYYWIIPGLILYFFSIGFADAPLQRFILFATPVSKGTASAFKSLIAMLLIGIGVEVGNRAYIFGGMRLFALFCALSGIGYAILVTMIMRSRPHQAG